MPTAVQLTERPPQPAEKLAKKRVEILDILRGLGILYVVLYHVLYDIQYMFFPSADCGIFELDSLFMRFTHILMHGIFTLRCKAGTFPACPRRTAHPRHIHIRPRPAHTLRRYDVFRRVHADICGAQTFAVKDRRHSACGDMARTFLHIPHYAV